MSRISFTELLGKMQHLLLRNEARAKASSRSVITPVTRLAVTLRFLAGGSYQDICFAWGVSKTAFYDNVVWPTLTALDSVLLLGFPHNDPDAIRAHRAACGIPWKITMTMSDDYDDMRCMFAHAKEQVDLAHSM